jgi:molybdopterin biosynthesis enzyme
MADRPKLDDAVKAVMELSYPPTTLVLPPSRAVGHRLAAPVVAKSAQPSRPFALVDGLAVLARDVVAPRRRGDRDTEPELEQQPEVLGGDDEPATAEPAAELLEATATNGDLTDHMVVTSGYASEGEIAGQVDVPEDSEQMERLEEREDLGTVRLTLRPPPSSNRKEEALQPGQAIPVSAGAEVPRGGELIIPYTEIAGEPSDDLPFIDPALRDARESQLAAAAAARARAANMPRSRRDRNAAEEQGEDDDDGALPALEPPREWDLHARFAKGEIELPRYGRRPAENMVGIGGWVRARQEILPERAVIRAGEMALLEALGIEDVEVYRKPVVGVASLAPPMPRAQRVARRAGAETMMISATARESVEEMTEGYVDPIALSVLQLCKTAQVAALPLGFAPTRFRPLALSVERWLDQVDVLLLVGGSHLGPRCLSQDVIAALGRVNLAGVDVQPAGASSAGMIGDKPVFALPGSLPDALAAFVLLVRPLLHKYLPPQHFEGSLTARLERGLGFAPERPTALPVRLRDTADGVTARLSGSRRDDPWMRFIRANGLIVVEPDASYDDGAEVQVHLY